MINKILSSFSKTQKVSFEYFSKLIVFQFCGQKDFSYFQNQKKRRYQQNLLTDFKVDHSKLIKSTINMNQLSPSFFASKLEMFEYPKIILQNKSKNHFSNSYVCIPLQLQSCQQLKNLLKKFTEDKVRIGRLLQIMDSVAGLVSYRHCFGSISQPNPFILVTGSVQSLQFFKPINCLQNIKIQGYLNYVGRTSLEIQVNIIQGNYIKSNCYFTMISRNSQDPSKGFQCPKLIFSQLETNEQKKAQARLNRAFKNIQIRKFQLKNSYQVKPPSAQQIIEIHQMFMNKKDENQNKFKIPIGTTKIQNNLIMHSQERNVHGKIFGGFLMRQMLQTGWFAGKKFLNQNQFQIQGITDFYFKSPVEIGTGLTITAKVTYSDGNIIILTIEALSTNFQTGQKSISCSSKMILKTVNNPNCVYAQSYEQALQYLNSRKTYMKLFKA